MSTASFSRSGLKVPSKYVPVLASFGLFVLMFVIGAMRYPSFGDAQVILNIFVDNAFLLVVAVGMTFVILTGGIDLGNFTLTLRPNFDDSVITIDTVGISGTGGS